MSNETENLLSFEAALKRLEEIVRTLESGNASLEDSIKLFEEGVKLSGYCGGLLKEAEQKVVQLTKNGEEDFKPLEEQQ